jgi:2-oxoglutarate ferredoxin oxidoreductase subunit beta
MKYKDYVNWDKMPTTWCGGCGIGIIFKQVTFALEELDIPVSSLAVVSGIGCSGRAAGYFAADSVHVTHGRALPVAEGIKRGNPKLNVLVFSGDGDLVGIGGNHLIHSSRRDIDITVVCINNQIYGMTGGQMAPTTPREAKTPTSAHGNPYSPINIQGLVTANSRYFYARSSAQHIQHLKKTIKAGIEWKGFAFIDAQSYCIENFGRRLGYRTGHEMLAEIKKGYKINSKPEGQLKSNELGIITHED